MATYQKRSKVKQKWFDIALSERRLSQKVNEVEKVCQEKKVLDVGCIGQAVSFEDPNWIHNRVKKVANSVCGVDIDTEGVLKLRENGYKMLTVEELEEQNEKFDVVLILDVIEHVDNPVELLRYYKQYLADDGLLLVSTPNANRSASFVNILLTNDYSLNMEHVFAMCPKTFLEVLERAGSLEPVRFYWLNYYDWSKRGGFKQWVKLNFSRILFGLRRSFSPGFMYALRRTS
jgi:2-polyprenyl-3-methyl-5-hydroxy-6-metoxy-1,4-benzoquinol methylase